MNGCTYLISNRQGKGGIHGFIEVLGLLKALHQEGWLQILPCGRSAALNQQASWGGDENPFIDLLHPCFLGPLSRRENNSLMSTLGLRAGLTFTTDALDFVYQETAGHPAFSRALGSEVLRAGPMGQVDTSHVTEAMRSLLADHSRSVILRGIYESRLDEEEKVLARKLALEGAQPRRALFPAHADIEHRRRIRDALQNLLDTTVLIQQPDGKIAHRYGLLRRVIQQEMEELGY